MLNLEPKDTDRMMSLEKICRLARERKRKEEKMFKKLANRFPFVLVIGLSIILICAVAYGADFPENR